MAYVGRGSVQGSALSVFSDMSSLTQMMTGNHYLEVVNSKWDDEIGKLTIAKDRTNEDRRKLLNKEDRSLSDGEVLALMRMCAEDSTPAGARDAAIIALLRGTGMRGIEAAALDVTELRRATGALTIRNGKGNKDRQTYVANGPQAALDEWLLVRGAAPATVLRGNKGWSAGRQAARSASHGGHLRRTSDRGWHENIHAA